MCTEIITNKDLDRYHELVCKDHDLNLSEEESKEMVDLYIRIRNKLNSSTILESWRVEQLKLIGEIIRSDWSGTIFDGRDVNEWISKTLDGKDIRKELKEIKKEYD